MESLCMRKWLFQCGLSEDQHIGVCLTHISRATAGSAGRRAASSTLGEAFFCPSLGEGNTSVSGKQLGPKTQEYFQITHWPFQGIRLWLTAESRYCPLLRLIFSCKQAATTAPAAASGWSCQEVPSGLQCSHVGWWSHSQDKHLGERERRHVGSSRSRLVSVENQSRTELPRAVCHPKLKKQH